MCCRGSATPLHIVQMHSTVCQRWLSFLLLVAVADNPKIRGLAAQSALTMNQEMEGHKGSASFCCFHFRLHCLVVKNCFIRIFLFLCKRLGDLT